MSNQRRNKLTTIYSTHRGNSHSETQFIEQIVTKLTYHHLNFTKQNLEGKIFTTLIHYYLVLSLDEVRYLMRTFLLRTLSVKIKGDPIAGDTLGSTNLTMIGFDIIL